MSSRDVEALWLDIRVVVGVGVRSSVEGFVSVPICSTFVEHDFPGADEHVLRRLRCRALERHDQTMPILPSCLDDAVLVVQRLVRKIHLGHKPVAAAKHVEVDVRRPPDAGIPPDTRPA
jgi:hypothetical protein